MAEERKVVTLRLSIPLLTAVDGAASAASRNRHDWLVDVIERGLDAPVERDCGAVERETRKDVAALVTSHPMGEALAALAFSLARSLDDGAGMATAAVSRELRATLIELAKYESGGVDDDDDGPDLGAPALGDASDPDETEPW